MRYFIILLMMSFSSVATEHDFSWSGVIPASITVTATKNHSVNAASIHSKQALDQLMQSYSQLFIISHKYKTADIHMITVQSI